MKYKTIAVDLDGTVIQSSNYPYVDSVNLEAVSVLRRFKAMGGKIVIFTCRAGEGLDLALEALAHYGVEWDTVNKDTQEAIDNWLSQYPNSPLSPKPWCDLYIDDKAWPCNLIGIDWKKVGEEICTL